MPGTRRATARRSAQELESAQWTSSRTISRGADSTAVADQLDREVADRVGSDVGFELRDARRDGQLDRQDRVEKRRALEQRRVAAEAGEHGGLDDGVVGPVGGVDVERLEQRTTPDVVRRRSLDRVGLAQVDPHRRRGTRDKPADQLGFADTGFAFEDDDAARPGRGRAAPGARQGVPLGRRGRSSGRSGRPARPVRPSAHARRVGRSRGLDPEGLDAVGLALELEGAERPADRPASRDAAPRPAPSPRRSGPRVTSRGRFRTASASLPGSRHRRASRTRSGRDRRGRR